MPTIAQLPAATASTDDDELVVSQNGVVRSVTRAQLLAGAQQAITVATGQLLGRCSLTSGSPEPVTLGAGLTLQNGILTAVPPPTPILTSLDASAALVTPAGATVGQTLAHLLADAVSPESFGAIGDGITDDTAALSAAIATNRPIKLGPRVYATTGQWTIPYAATLLGVQGQTIIRRLGQAQGGAWISIQGSSFLAEGVIFDANGKPAYGDRWALLVTASCTTSCFRRCQFLNASGTTLGHGLTVLASDPASTSHTVDFCDAFNNSLHGIWIQAVDGARLTNNRLYNNGGYGICVDYADPRLQQAVRLAQITGNHSWSNSRGIAVGNFNETNAQPPTWGLSSPDAISVLIANNVCFNNSVYGIAVSGKYLALQSNLLDGNGSIGNGGAGILANCSSSRVYGNTITGVTQFGIDSGGSMGVDISANYIAGAAVGINPGGSQQVRITGNFLQANEWALLLYNVETDGRGGNFGLSTVNVDICDNTIVLSNASGGGIWLIDAPQNILVARNSFVGIGNAAIGQCLYAHTDSAIVEGNRWNNSPRLFANPTQVNGALTVVLPDIADDVMLSSVSGSIQSIQTTRQIDIAGQLGYIKITSPGTGYSKANVVISGSGTGAAGIANISGGSIIGVSLTAAGTGYGTSGAVADVTISGDGSGAQAVAVVGLPVLEGRRVKFYCNTAVTFMRTGSTPFQDNWTLDDFTVPANASTVFTGTFGSWRAETVPLADYIQPPGDGSVTIRSMQGGDIMIRPTANGQFRLTSDSDPVGCVVAIGHGSPETIISAPPGSDYRNLDGGAGQTLWIKCSGSGSDGWIAIA